MQGIYRPKMLIRIVNVDKYVKHDNKLSVGKHVP